MGAEQDGARKPCRGKGPGFPPALATDSPQLPESTVVTGVGQGGIQLPGSQGAPAKNLPGEDRSTNPSASQNTLSLRDSPGLMPTDGIPGVGWVLSAPWLRDRCLILSHPQVLRKGQEALNLVSSATATLMFMREFTDLTATCKTIKLLEETWEKISGTVVSRMVSQRGPLPNP